VRSTRCARRRRRAPGSAIPDPPDAALAERRSVAFAGTAVVGGRGEGIVTAIGRWTEMGRIAGSLARPERRRSPLQHELDRLVRILLAVAVVLIAITTGLGFLRGQEPGANVLAGISAAIAAIPEEPPILLAVILGLGAYRLLRRGVLVRRLNAEEILGAIDLIVVDKTGTLTENRLEVASVRAAGGPLAETAERERLLVEALRAEDDAWRLDEGVAPSSFTLALARALATAADEGEGGPGATLRRAGLDPAALLDARGASDERPFSTTRSRAGDRVVELALGAPEAVLALVGGPGRGAGAPDGLAALRGGGALDWRGPDPTIPGPATTDAGLDAWHAQVAAGAAAGERLLGLARRDDDGPWRVRALIGFADPLRPGIREAMAMAGGAGIQTIMVTGDHPQTATAIAREAGLEADRVVLGDELRAWPDDRIARELGGLHVVARSVPEDKERIVRVARQSGRMVAVTGDGVNDAPALQRADVAVAMGSGTAVAREASDLVLGDDSFATLLYGLAEGRRIVDNVQKGLVFLISTHVALLGFVLIATLYGFGQPLLPIQILWLELFIDVSTSIAFEREPREPDLMARPPRRRGEPLLPAWLLGRIAVAGSFSAVSALLLMVAVGSGGDHGRWLAFTALVLGQVVRGYANRSLRTPVHRLPRNGFLGAAIVLVILAQVLIPAVPALADAFRATPLAAGDWLLVALVGLSPAVLAEGVRTARPGTSWVA
jgi:Ca2+-transporting ATPase